jgi:hypothetical protein
MEISTMKSVLIDRRTNIKQNGVSATVQTRMKSAVTAKQ